VHPPVHERRRELSVAARESGEWLCLDIPLLYESCSADDFDRVVVVACSEATQLRRLCELRLLPKETAAQMIRSQLPLADKVIKSDHLIWNDGPLTLLHGQSCILASALRARFPR
jgi:dephospho-CoA kinase